MSEKGSTSDVKNAMEGDSKRTRDQVGPESNAVVSNAILHAFPDIQCNMIQHTQAQSKVWTHLFYCMFFSWP